MTETQLSLFAGSLLSLAFSYIPGLNDWFNGQESTAKRLVMAGALLVVALGVLGSACAGLNLPVTETCDQNGIIAVLTNFVLALIANQATYQLAPQPEKKTVQEVIEKK